MAKLSTKFVKIPVRVDAKVLVGGKKKNASATDVGKSIKSVFQGINSLGLTLESEVAQESETTAKLKAVNLGLQDFEEKRKELNKSKDEYLDLVTSREESAAPASKPGKPTKKPTLKPDPNVKKAVDKEAGPFGKGLLTLGKFLGGFKGLLSRAFFVTAGLAALKWFADPANAEKVDDIVNGLKGVFGFIWDVTQVVGGLVVGGIVNLGSGLGKIFGSGGDPKEILSGFGDLLQALPGIATIGFLLNPMGAFKAIIKILTSWREPKQKEPEAPEKKKQPDADKPKDVDSPDKPKDVDTPDKAPKAPDAPDAPPKKKGFFGGIGDSINEINESINRKVQGVTEFATEQGKRLQTAGSGLVDALDKRMGGIIEALGAGWKKLSEGTKAAITALQENADKLVKKGQAGVFDWLSNQKGILGTVGRALPDFMQKLGKYLPFVGDIAGFVFDIMAGVDWRRALIRALVGATIDAGFTALMAAMGLGAPFTGGATGIAATALYVAYMGADLAVGGLGKLIGDPISDALGIPEMAGESSEKATPGSVPSAEQGEKISAEAIAAKDPDYLTKIAEKEGNTAEDGGILSPGGKILPFGAATTSENKDDIRDLVGVGTSIDNKSVRGLLKQAIDQQKIFADTIYQMKQIGFFEKGLEAFKDLAEKLIPEPLLTSGEKVLSLGNTILGIIGAKLGIGDGAYGEEPLKKAAEGAGIKGKELAAFLAQMSHESGGFKYKTEIGGGKDSYDGGKRYKGRGYIQLTHKYNYKYYGDKLGLDLVNKPELAEGGETAAKIALLYWTENVRPTVNGNWDNVFLHSKAINYPAAKQPSDVNGMEDRQQRYDAYVKKLGLDKKAAGGMISGVPYVNQRALPNDSDGRAGDRQCYSATMSMLAQHLVGDKAKDYTQRRQKYGQSIHDSAQTPTLKEYGITGRRVTGATAKDVKSQLDQGTPTPLGLRYRGSGHWALAVGYDDKGMIISDPYGQLGKTDWIKTNSASPLNDGVGKYYRMPYSTYAVQNPEGDGHYWKIDNVNPDAALESTDGISESLDNSSSSSSSDSSSDAAVKKKKASSPEAIFAQLSAAIQTYKNAMSGNVGGVTTPGTPTGDQVSAEVPLAGIGPLADGDAYAKSLEGKSVGGEFDLTPTKDALQGSVRTFGILNKFLPPAIVPKVEDVATAVSYESSRMDSMQVSISNLQLNQTSNLLDKSKVVVAEKKVRRAAPNIINNTSHTRQTVMSGTNSFAVTASKRHTNFF